MNPHELRLGNYLIDTVGNIINIGSLQSNFYGENINGNDLDDYKPIPISEEWLRKLRFCEYKPGRYGYRYCSPAIEINYVIERDWREDPSHFFGIEYTDSPNPEDDYKVHNIAFELKYVHQLQNIYFALTGYELTIKD